MVASEGGNSNVKSFSSLTNIGVGRLDEILTARTHFSLVNLNAVDESRS